MKASPLPLAALVLTLGLAPFLRAEPGHKFAPLTSDETAMLEAALPAKPAEAPAKARKLLVFHRTEGFVHDSIGVANETLRRMGEATGAFTVTITDDMSAFEPANLAGYDAVAFVSTTQLKFENPAHRKALLDFVESGKGVVGIHAASDNFPTWPEGQALIGGCFHSHPWFASQVVAVKLDEPDHILNAGFEKRGFRVKEEIYRMKEPYSRQRQRVLVSLDMSKKENERPKAGITGTDGDFGISWIKSAGKGRVFYSSLGHNKDIYFVPAIQRHFLDGIRFALGDLAADAVPSVALPTKPTPALAPDSGPTLQDLARVKFSAGALERLAAFRDGDRLAAVLGAESLVRSLPAPERAEAEKTLLATLEKATDPVARHVITRVLAHVGGAASVPALEAQVKEPLCSADAATGLALIADKSAEAALIRLAEKASPHRVTAINALAARRSVTAIPALAAIAAENSPDAEAALQGLALAGSPEALKTLRSLKVTNEDARTAAILGACERLLDSGKDAARSDVASVARDILAKNKEDMPRVSAVRLLLAAEPGASSEVAPLLKDASALVRRSVARSLVLTGDAKAIAAVVETFTGEDRVAPLAALAAAADSASPAALPVAKAGLAAPATRAAAARAVALCGDAEAVAALAPLLAEDADTALAARRALGLPSSEKFTAALREAATTATEPAVRAGLLSVLADRRDHTGFAIAAALTKESDAKLRLIAFEALPNLTAPGDLPAVLATGASVKKSAERRAWQKAVFTATATHPDSGDAAKLLSEAAAKADPAGAQVLVGALTTLNGERALESVRTLLASRADTDARKEVVRALASARNTTARTLLLEDAKKAADSGERTLALRGYLDTVAALGQPAVNRVADYRAAWPLAGAEEKDAIIAAVKDLKGNEAQKFLSEIAPAPAPATATAPTSATQTAKNG